MTEKKMGIMDAFVALKNEDWEGINEAKSFNLRDNTEVAAAAQFIKEDAQKEPELEVIDIDADTEEHLRNKTEYIGELLLKCCACGETHCISADKLVKSEADDKVYNPDDVCTHCGAPAGTGYLLVGQIGDPSNAEASIKNDEKNDDEPKIENDEAKEEPKEEEAPEEEAAEETGEPEEEEPSEDAMDTKAADDTEDMESTLGEAYDADDVAWDDTEALVEEVKEETNSYSEMSEEVEPAAAEPITEEVVEEAIDPRHYTIEDLVLGYYPSPETIKEVVVFDEDGKVLFQDSYEHLMYDLSSSEVVEWGTQAPVQINISEDHAEGDSRVSDILRTIDETTEIELYDAITSEQLDSGNRDTVDPKLLDHTVTSIEFPSMVKFTVKNSRGVAIKAESLEKPVELPDEWAMIDEDVRKGAIERLGGSVTEALSKEEIAEIKEEEKKEEADDKKITTLEKELKIESIEQPYKSFRTRKALGEEIEALEAAGREYQVKRSVVEGYRYDLFVKPSTTIISEELSDELTEEVETNPVNEGFLYDLEDAEGSNFNSEIYLDKLAKQINDYAHAYHDALMEVYEIDVPVDDIYNAQENDMLFFLDEIPQQDWLRARGGRLDGMCMDFKQHLSGMSNEEKAQAILDRATSDAGQPWAAIISDRRFIGAVQHGVIPFLRPEMFRESLEESYDAEWQAKRKAALKQLAKTTASNACVFGYGNYSQHFYVAPKVFNTDTSKGQEAFRNFCDSLARDSRGRLKWSVDVVYRRELEDLSEEVVLDDVLEVTNDGPEFDAEKFDEQVNAYYMESLTDKVMVYRTVDGGIKEDGTIIVEGFIDTDETSDTPISFTLTPNIDSNNEKVYTVTNNLTEEIITVKSNLIAE